MADHMWNAVEDDEVPSGCVQIDVLYEDGTKSQICSCDFWWSKKPIVYWRLSDVSCISRY